METLPIYYNAAESSTSSTSTSTEPSPRSQSRLSFPVSVHSLAYSENVPPPLPTRSNAGGESSSSSSTSSRQSKRGSVMLLNNGQWGGNQQDWMTNRAGQYNLDQLREEEEEQSSIPPSSLFPESTINLSQIPPRSSSRSPIPRLAPSLPPRPTKLSSPILTTNLPSSSSSIVAEEPPLVSPSSCPPSLSPFSTMSSQSLSHPQPRSSMLPPPLPPTRSKSPRFPRPSTSSSTNSMNSPQSSLPTSSSSSSLNFGTSALSALNRGFRQTGLKDRLAAGAGFAREWSGKGKGRLQDGYNAVQNSSGSSGGGRPSTSSGRGGEWDGSSSSSISKSSISTSASSPQLDSFPLHQQPTTSSSSSTTMILGIRVPRIQGLAFGVPLYPLVSTTHVSLSAPGHVPLSSDPITGTRSQRYLPAIAYRCLEYLSEWGVKEEGIYRIPGRSGMVGDLKKLFDAGLGAGSECDLREFQPDELDPNAVASCFKNWLRSLPESLLGNELEPRVDEITLHYLGYTASSTQFLGSSSNTNTPTTSPNPDSTSSSASSSKKDYLEELQRVFEREMKAENYYLLRAISYHLHNLASNADKNKMNLTNLRLILSPTLRLSPGFLMILVEDRETIFSGDCLDAKRREGLESELVSPNLPSSPTFKNLSSSTTNSPSRPSFPQPQPSSPSRVPALPPRPSIDDSSLDSTLSSPTSHDDLETTQILPLTRVSPKVQEEEEEEEIVRERERIRSCDLKLRLPEGLGDGLGLGLGSLGASEGIEGVLLGREKERREENGVRR